MTTPAKHNNDNKDSGLPLKKEEMQAALDQVLSSKHFVHAPMKQRFLKLICDFHLNGRGGELNEYLIGREVFDRDSSYNPATDPIVRVGAHGVREKLERYYQKEGANDDIRIKIPIGSYEPCFARIIQQPLPEIAPEKEVRVETSQVTEKNDLADVSIKSYIRYVPHIIAVILTVFALGLAYSNFNLRRQMSVAGNLETEEQEVYQPVWQAFLKSPDPTLLVLSNPPVFRFANPADPPSALKSSIPVSTVEANSILSGIQNKSIMRIITNPRLMLTTDTYTGIGEAIGIYHITDLFRSNRKSLTLKQSRTVSAEDLKSQNIVALGSIWVNNWSSKLQFKQDFIYTNQVTIENLNPLPGEQREYRSIFDEQTGQLTEEYAIITVGPNTAGRSGHSLIMVLAGLHSEGTAAAAEFITNTNYLAQFNQFLTSKITQNKAPRHYQALLKVNVDNGIPTTISLISIHELNHL